MKKCILIIFGFSFFHLKADPNFDIDWKWVAIPSAGLIFQDGVFGDYNIGFGKAGFLGKVSIVHLSGRLGIEHGINLNTETIGLKLGTELNAGILALRLSGIQYFTETQSQFRILPEIGLCIGSYDNFMYGYGIPFDNNRFNDLSCSKFSLSVNIPIN